jgi:hypothetical protein
VPVIGSAAATEHGQLRQLLTEFGVLLAEFSGISGIQFRHRIKLGMAPGRSVRLTP